jgi:acetoin utilization protein AcuB
MMEQLKVPVDEFTTPAPQTVDLMTPMSELLGMMERERFRHIPVTDNDEAVGIISDRDLKMFTTLGGGDSILARDVMTPHPYVAASGTPLHDVAFQMSKEKIGSAIIVDEQQKVIGIFTSTDALNALIEVLRGELDL